MKKIPYGHDKGVRVQGSKGTRLYGYDGKNTKAQRYDRDIYFYYLFCMI